MLPFVGKVHITPILLYAVVASEEVVFVYGRPTLLSQAETYISLECDVLA